MRVILLFCNLSALSPSFLICHPLRMTSDPASVAP
jgi:hypothetical protein